MSTKLTECWSSDSQADGLRIELSSEHCLLLPFNQFLLAELKIENKEHHLRLVFVMHEVLISGKNLRRLQIAMQKKELAFVAKVSNNYQLPPADGSPLIQSIVVTEAKSAKKSEQSD
jgi:hypothetical protein